METVTTEFLTIVLVTKETVTMGTETMEIICNYEYGYYGNGNHGNYM
jgi:hypothetical protein